RPPGHYLAAPGAPPSGRPGAPPRRGQHRWSRGETAGRPSYLGVSGKPGVAGSFLLLLGPAEVWLKPAAAAADTVPGDARALADAGWRQVVSRFDAGVTRQHRH
ncbi:hypothetical protein OFL55_25010, partial [Pseudomonas aeruginosa]|nr:hypothetical protein [Pseudomonas aeruginosa]